MTRFAVHDGHFWIDDQPVLLQAGEFHYFRTPRDQWAHRLGLLREAGFNAVAAYIPWLWHQPAPDALDLDGHTHPLRDLAGFLDLAADMGLWIIARPGPYIMAETINEGIPPWVFERHPDVAFIDQTGRPHNVVSYLHPAFLAEVEGWYRGVFSVLAPRQIDRGGRVVLIQLDNEMGMIQWVRNIHDRNPHTLARFAAFLRTTYGAALTERYPAADLIAFLDDQLARPDAEYGALVLADYRRFYRGYLREYMVWLWDTARACGMDVPPVVNIHGFANGGKTFPIGLSQLIDVMALDGMISATDVYPMGIGEGNVHQLLLVNEMTKALHNPAQPLFSIEFQAGGNQDFSGAQSSFYDLHTRLCLSCGMRAINHYLFFDGENDPILSPVKRHDWGHPVRKDGTLRRHYARYPKLSRVLAAYGADLTLARPVTTAAVGFLLDQFMTEVNNVWTQPVTDVLTHQREVILFDLLARGLALTHRPFTAIELARGTLDPARTPVLFAMLERQCDADVQRKLVEYVRGGGRLVAAGRLCEVTFVGEPCTILRDALGVGTVTAGSPFTPMCIRAFDQPDLPVSFVEMYTGAFDEVIAVTDDGQTVGFVQRVGAGEVLMLGAAFAANTLDDLAVFERMASRMGSQPAFTVSDWVDVRLSQGENGAFLFVSNYQDDPITTTIARGGVPLFGGQALTLPARRGLILPLDWRVRPGVTLRDATGEVIAVSEDGPRLTLRIEPPVFRAELKLDGWRCADGMACQPLDAEGVVLTGTDGLIELVRAD
jgi:beta-galactosidase